MKNLVICCAGDNSLHPNWIRDRKEKEFDLLIIYYGDQENKWKETCDHYFVFKGLKSELLSRVLKENSSLIEKYDYIWSADDDIFTDTKTINELFKITAKYKLDLAQPSLHPSSYIALSITRQRLKYFMRYTNFVEVMVPLFSKEALFKISGTFAESKSNWGLDWVWPILINPGHKRNNVAIIDKISVIHTKPVNREGGFYKQLQVTPDEEKKKTLEKYNLTEDKFNYRIRIKHGPLSLVLPTIRMADVWKYRRRLKSADSGSYNNQK